MVSPSDVAEETCLTGGISVIVDGDIDQEHLTIFV